MNKTMKKLLAMLMTLMMALSMASAEEAIPERVPGDLPERGLVFPMTEADTKELGLSVSFTVAGTMEVPELPIVTIAFSDAEGLEKTMQQYADADMSDEDVVWEVLIEMFSHTHTLCNMILFEKDYFDAKEAAGITPAELLEADTAYVLGENDGYVYVVIEQYNDAAALMETETQKAAAEKAIARCKELLETATFQPIVFAEGEFTEAPESAIAFTTQDLYGNTFTQDLFLGKKLTVLNVWGTHCTPCINEMPELAEWSQNMPEGVQLVGLVSDLNSADNTEVFETAQYICEATGANVYTNLIANADFLELLSGVVGVPTTFFIDGNGQFVGDPIVGANVAGCKAAVEALIAE